MTKSSGLGTLFSNSTHHASELPSSICWFCLGSILNPLGVLNISIYAGTISKVKPINFQPKCPWQIICHQLFCKVIGKLIVSNLCSGQATQACGIPGAVGLMNGNDFWTPCVLRSHRSAIPPGNKITFIGTHMRVHVCILYIWCCIVLAIHAGKAIGLFSHMFSHITQPTAWKVFLGSCCVKQASDMRSVYTHCYQLSTANQHPETKLSIDTFIEAKTYLELRRFRFGARGAGVSSSSPSSAHSASATASAASGSAFTRLRVVVRAFALGGPGAFTALAIRGRKLIGHP